MSSLPRRIFLIGPMGSGKTTLGRRLAQNLGLQFFDCDDEIEKRTGASINLIFDIEGEQGFRARETQMLEQLARSDGVVIATGGGAVLSPPNRDLMRRSSLVVWLKASVDQQIRRLQMDKTRPLLQASDRRERLAQLARERNPLYRDLADLEFNSSSESISTVAAALTRAVNDYLATGQEPSSAIR